MISEERTLISKFGERKRGNLNNKKENLEKEIGEPIEESTKKSNEEIITVEKIYLGNWMMF